MKRHAVAEREPGTDIDFTFKIATAAWELDQIPRLNYSTFVEEIPQHQSNESRRLVDRFHDENTYFICLRGDELVGMVAARDQRPFSLDEKLGSLDHYLPRGRSSVCEIRLLSIEKEHRNGRVIQGLLSLLAKHCVASGYDLAVISGNVRQDRLYRRLGFVPFGPKVGTSDAPYQPMYRDLTTLTQDFAGRFHPSVQPNGRVGVNLVPGPVSIHPRVRKAFTKSPVSHWSAQFMAEMRTTKRRLCELVGAENVEILLGSGTAANDAVAAQLSLDPGQGLILSNGEFGDRLIDHAARMGLEFDVVKQEWGLPFAVAELSIRLDTERYAWLWTVHCETSTGVLNDIDELKSACSQTGTKLALDCISSIGTLPVGIAGVYLASCVSGKGLGSYPGLSMVFYNHEVHPRPDRLPRYLDIGLYAAKGGVPFSMSSNLVYALYAALDRFDSPDVFDESRDLSAWLRMRLRALGFEIVADDSVASPAVITLALPRDVNSVELGDRLELEGFSLSYNSEYLHSRNWAQVCLMGDFSRSGVEALLDAIARIQRDTPSTSLI